MYPLRNKILLILGIIVLYIIIDRCCRYENFSSNDILNSDMTIMGNSLCSSNSDDSFLINRKTITSETFVIMNDAIKDIVIDIIIEYANICKDMNGSDGLGDNKSTLTLSCNTDPWDMEEKIVEKITDYIKTEVYRLLEIDIDRLIIVHDLMKHLNLLENIIYPLQNSNLYTVHGIQYITVNNIKNIVMYNLEVKDVLYTILSRRNITVINNSDKHI